MALIEEKKLKMPSGFDDNLACMKTLELVYLRKLYEFLKTLKQECFFCCN